ncbi:MAG: tetratricopeptide repeat protein [Acidobacteria bacterium]|nr:tetratricopeptide repeat protein [Acidobacteriota bacterium]
MLGENSRGSFLATVVLFLSGFVVYANTLTHGFVFDDLTMIYQNPQVTRLRWSEILSLEGYRPVRTLTYAFNYAQGGDNPFGYHLLNVMLHGLNVVALFALFRMVTRSALSSFAGAVIFAVHPVQTAAVAYISGRKDLLATFFVVTALLCYAQYRKLRKPLYLAGSALCFLLGILSKEVAIVFPALLLLWDFFIPVVAPRTKKQPVVQQPFPVLARKNVWLYVIFLLLSILSLYWAVFWNQASRMIGYWGGAWTTHVGTSFKLFVHYLKLAVFPHPLIADYTGDVFKVSKGLLDPATLLAILITVGYLFATVFLISRDRRLTFGLLWFFVALLPVLQLIPFHELAADHFMYLPLVGISLAGGLLLQKAIQEKDRQVLASGLFILVVILSVVMTVRRNRDWKDERTLWEATLKAAPGSYRANTNLGVIYQGERESSKALRYTLKSLELDPNQAASWSNLGAIYHDLAQEARRGGELEEGILLSSQGIKSLEKAIALNPADAFAYGNLGSCYKEIGLIRQLQGRPEQALEARKKAVRHFHQGLRVGSQNELIAGIWFNLGMIFVESGYYDQAIEYLIHFVRVFPNFPEGQYWMGYSYFQIRDYRSAIPYLENACALQPKLDAWGMLASSYEATGETAKAIETNLRSLNLFPNSAEIHYNLGVLYHRTGKAALALEHLEKALELSPEGPLLRNIHELLNEVNRHVSRS